MTRKWPFGRRDEADGTTGDDTRHDTSTDPNADAGAADSGDSSATGSDWWLGGTPSTTPIINRRWRRTRPDDLHPHRRVEDRTTPVNHAPDPLHETFDPDALFAPSTSTSAPPSDPTPLAEPEGSTDTAIEPWATLGLTSVATWPEVVARHRELAKVHHPDRHATDGTGSDAARRMAAINAAFAELGKIYAITGDR